MIKIEFHSRHQLASQKSDEMRSDKTLIILRKSGHLLGSACNLMKYNFLPDSLFCILKEITIRIHTDTVVDICLN